MRKFYKYYVYYKPMGVKSFFDKAVNRVSSRFVRSILVPITLTSMVLGAPTTNARDYRNSYDQSVFVEQTIQQNSQQYKYEDLFGNRTKWMEGYKAYSKTKKEGNVVSKKSFENY